MLHCEGMKEAVVVINQNTSAPTRGGFAGIANNACDMGISRIYALHKEWLREGIGTSA